MLAVLLLSILLVIGFGISILMFQQMRLSGQAGRSVVAFYAADAGAEKCLYEVRKDGAVTCPFTDIALDFDAQATYTVDYNGVDEITSIGKFRGTTRKIELTW